MPKKPISKEIKIASFASMFKESDKGCVLLVASLFEHLLEQIHEAATAIALVAVETPKNFFREKLVANRGPLSDFYGKINLAFGYGLIPRYMYEGLNVIRDLRNEAAHCVFDFSLNDVGVRAHLNKLEKFDKRIDQDRIMKFESYLPEITDANRMKFAFILRTHVILSELQGILIAQLERLIEERKRKKPVNVIR